MSLPYGEVVLEHFRRPRNQRTLEQATAEHEAFNPLCGDRVRVAVRVEDGQITDVAFTANACALCTASASLLTERVKGMQTGAAIAVSDAEAVTALETTVPAAREACATLPWTALRTALAR